MTTTQPQTALARLQSLWAAGDYRASLKLAASWPQLGRHRGAIRDGWDAVVNADTYRQMGRSPAAMERAGIAAVAERYSLDV